MIVDAREILFIRKNAPYGMMRVVATNTGFEYSQVRTELNSLKEEYDDKIVIESRRLLKEMTGLVYQETQEA